MRRERERSCRSKHEMEMQMGMMEMRRRLELLETVQSRSSSSEEKVQKAMMLHEQAEAVVQPCLFIGNPLYHSPILCVPKFVRHINIRKN